MNTAITGSRYKTIQTRRLPKARRCCLTFASRVRGQPDGPHGGLGPSELVNPIPLSQRLRLAKRVERIGSDVGAFVGQIVVSSAIVSRLAGHRVVQQGAKIAIEPRRFVLK